MINKKFKIINVEYLENLRKEKGLTISKLCKLTKISYSTYKRIISNENFILTALFRLAKFYNVEICKLFLS